MSLFSLISDSIADAGPDITQIRDRLRAGGLLFFRKLALFSETSENIEKIWKSLGMVVARVPLPSHGGFLERHGQLHVFVDQKDLFWRQQFTVAHEIGHFLLMKAFPRDNPLSYEEEEDLCDDFASHLLIPRAILEKECGKLAHGHKPYFVLDLCRLFKTSISAMLLALADIEVTQTYSCFTSFKTSHSYRNEEIEFRFRESYSPRYFYLPPEKRVISLGFSNLVDFAETSSQRPFIAKKIFHRGSDDVVLQVRLPNVSESKTKFIYKEYRGIVYWAAALFKNRTPHRLFVSYLTEEDFRNSEHANEEVRGWDTREDQSLFFDSGKEFAPR
jgi:hypothetical protein